MEVPSGRYVLAEKGGVLSSQATNLRRHLVALAAGVSMVVAPLVLLSGSPGSAVASPTLHPAKVAVATISLPSGKKVSRSVPLSNIQLSGDQIVIPTTTTTTAPPAPVVTSPPTTQPHHVTVAPVTTTTAPSVVASSLYAAWTKVADCEAGGWYVLGTAFPDSLGISASNWYANGGGSDTSPSAQIAVAERFRASLGIGIPDQNGSCAGW